MTGDEARQWWFGRVNFEQIVPKPGDLSLERMRLLLHRLGDPQQRYRILHIAGSKGKGSTSAMLAAILERAGFRTGLFTSPHLVHVAERVQVNGQPIADQACADLLTEIRSVAQAPAAGESVPLNESLTFFEIATALGFLHFARQRCDWAVVEVGLGGRFDSTNVCLPDVGIITSISFDHTRQLGNTLAKIAFEKAGIIKPGRPTVSGVTTPEARDVIRQACRERNAPLREVETDFRYEHRPARFHGGGASWPHVQVATWRRAWPELELGLIGEHQAANAAVAVAAVETLREQGVAIDDEAVRHGLAEVRWPARLEVLGRRPLVLLDCAHNVASARALIDALLTSFPVSPGGRRRLIFAGSRDKDLPGILRELAPHFDDIYLTTFGNSPRAVLPDELATLLPGGLRGAPVLSATSALAWDRARSAAGPDDQICITGSVFLAGELRPALVDR